MRTRKIAALSGSCIMGMGSFMSCLSTNPNFVHTGNALLVISLILSIWGFAKWQP